MADSQDIGILKNLFNKSSEKKIVDKRDRSKGPKMSIPTDDIYYNTVSNTNIGFALIFNQMKIKKLDKREGSELDAHRMNNVLQLYGFEVTQFDDRNKEEIHKILLDYSKMDHSKHDCFVVIVLSHGKPGKVYAADKSYPVDDLWSPFLGENCPSLVNKPKLFFIQACRGKKMDDGVEYETDSINLNLSSEVKQIEEELITYHIPHTADLLVHYSTFENHVAWKNSRMGSYFIQHLAKVLEEYVQHKEGKELYFLLTKVNRNVAYEYQSYSLEEKLHFKKQMPCIVSTLTKIFLLTRKKRN